MREIGAFEAKNRFGQLLAQIEHGEEIVARRAVAGILRLSMGVTLGGLKIKDLINEGRP